MRVFSIPASAKIQAKLIECPELRRIHPISEIAGFDLSEFDVFRSPGYRQIDFNSIHHRTLSDVIELSRVDFQKDHPVEIHRSLAIEPTVEGICQAIVFWFDLYLDRDTIISTSSEIQTNHRKQCRQFFESDLPVRPGETVNLSVNQTRTGFDFSVE